MKRHVQALGAVFVVLLFSCDRDRDNPIDPNSSLLFLRPLTPVGLTAEGGTGLVFLSWEPVADKDLAGYVIYRSDTPDGTYEFIPGNTGSEKAITTGKTSFIDSMNVQPGTTLFYRVSAVDIDGFISVRSPFVGVTVKEDKVPPGVPQNLSAVAGEGGESLVFLRWSAPVQDADGGELTGLDRYVVLRLQEGVGSLVSVATLSADSLDAAGGILGAGVVEYVDRDLDPLTVYEYSVIAIDAAGNESSQALAVRVQSSGIEVPIGLQAVGGFRKVTLTWRASDEEDLLGYNAYSAASSDGEYEFIAGDGGIFTTGLTTFVNTGLTSDVVLFYRVTAVTTRGESQQSAFVGAQVQ